MRILKLTTLALALSGAFPAGADDPVANEKSTTPGAAAATTVASAAGTTPTPSTAASVQKVAEAAAMTPEQEADLNRVKVKTEALEDSRDASGLKGFKFSGYLDPAYVYNVNKERGTFQFIVPIEKEPYAYDNGYFATLALDIQKEMDSGTKFHFTLYPKRGGGDVMGENSIVHEASVWIPLGGTDTRLFAGQIPDWSGYEYYAPNMYKNVTHNLLFDFTLPSSYTGVGIELVRGKLDLKLMLANMNASVRNIGEQVPMFVFRGDYGVGEFWGWGFAGAAGYKTNYAAANDGTLDYAIYDNKDSLYTTLEIDAWYARGDWTMNGHVTGGTQKKASITPDPNSGKLRDSQWFGASVLAAYKFTVRTEFALRGDYIYNQKNGGGLLDYTVPDPVNGIGPDQSGGPGADANKGANRFAVTATLNYALNSNVLLKGEYRFDGADQAVFGNKDLLTGTGDNPKYTKNNSVIAGSVVVYF